MTKILFMGTPDFSATVLKGLISDERYEILAVVTQPDRAVGRKKEIRMTPVKEAALEAGLPIYQPEKLSGSQELEDLLALGADGIVTAAFGQFLPSRLLEAMKFSVNVHASLLPKYRGGAISSRAIPILEEDNVGTMFEKLALVGRDLLLETLPAYLAGELKPQPQDPQQVTFSPNIKPEEERLDWARTNRELFNQVRGMYPWPVAHTLWKGERFKIYQAKPCEGQGQPGTILALHKNEIVVATGEGALALTLVQPAGKPKMAVGDFLNGLGRQLQVGDQFGK